MEEVYPSERKVDELHLIALQDHEELFQISEEAYAEELQLQEILLPSSSSLVAEVVSSRSVISPPPVVPVLMEAVPSSSSEVKVVEENPEYKSPKMEEVYPSEWKVDELYLIALQDHDELFQISDEAYAEELQLQEILLPSSSLVAEVVSSRSVISPPPVVSVLMEAVPSSSSSEAKVVEEDVESSAKFCSICMDKKPCDEFFNGSSCAHSFCVDCTSTYVATKIQENISMVKCPDNKCKGIISPNDCNSIVPKQVLERWEKALVESLMLVSGTTLYCPFKECSALILNDDFVVGSAECPMCHRLFCTQCRVGWHQGVECSEFQSLSNADQIDVEAVKFAKGKSWQRCPKCQFFVEKTTGCLHIVCRCSFEFCYGCGSAWSSTHACSGALVE